MIRQSVKKPFTVLVAVIVVLMLAAVSLTRMTTDLLPTIDTPYLMVITTYVGASPEKVEEEVTAPLESSLGTVAGVASVTSSSAENYCMIMLEFEEDSDMDAALVKVNNALAEVTLPDLCGKPSIMEISMDMMATMYISVTREDMDIYELTDYVEDTLSPYFLRQNGVADVTSLGLVEEMVEVRLDQEKIDGLNYRLAVHVEDTLADSLAQLEDAQTEIDDGLATLEESESTLSDTQASTGGELGELTLQLNQALATQSAYSAILTSQQANQTALQAELQAYEDAGIQASYDQLNALFAQFREDPMLVAGGMADSLPADIADALADPGKLETAAAMLAAQEGMEETAAMLTADTLQQLYDIVNVRIPQIETELANLEVEIAASQAVLDTINETVDAALESYAQVEAGKIEAAASLGAASAQLTSAKSALEEAQTELDDAMESFETARDAALESANLDGLLTMDTLSTLIYAQNFSMPAGYIEDGDGEQWLLKVGEEFSSLTELREMVLTEVDGIGTITLEDVADITVIDNSADSYARQDGRDAVLLSIYKSSTAGTSAVSDTCNAAIQALTAENSALHVTVLMDQGDYIDLFISSIVKNILFGALLAIIVLAIFLRSVRPTLVVAFSIPFSVLVAVLIMYFTGITLNIMSMSGLALGIGMLVDNSIVVMENIFRLRGRDLPAPRAAYQGTKQVAGAIIASTLTTICVFLPMIFTTGTVRQLMVPFALTISFALLASLVVSLTAVPTLGSVLLRRATPKPSRALTWLQNTYGRVLGFCLRWKALPLGIAVLLLAFSVYMVARMGIVLIPDMNSDQLFLQVEMSEDMEMDDCYDKADAITETLLAVDGVDSVGVMTNLSGLISSSLSTGSNDYYDYTYYLVLDEAISSVKEVNAVGERIEAALAGDEAYTFMLSASSAGDLSSLMSSGLSIEIYGEDLDTLSDIAAQVKALVEEVDGFTDVTDGQEENDQTVHLSIDKDRAMALGISVAQIYSDIAARLTTEETAATITVGDRELEVVVVDETDVLTLEDLLEIEYEVESTDDDGETVTETYTLADFAEIEYTDSLNSITRENGTHVMTVSATTEDGYNTTRLSQKVQAKLDALALPSGYTAEISGEVEQVMDMLTQMLRLLALGLVLVYLVMVAQFQSLLSPFIVLFTVPLAFTGGLIGLLISGDQISIVSLLGFAVLMGTVVNNGIVFVDYVNQLRLGGLDKRQALIATGKTRLRPILMTALTTILAMSTMMFSTDITASMSRGMAVVVSGGLAYATLMTLFVVPVMYDIFYRRTPREIDVGNDLDDAPQDAEEFLRQMEG